MMKKVTKAVIPAAGLGTRVLPATKAMPKGMLPIVDKPAIQYIVEEAVAAGIEEILIITGRGGGSIEDLWAFNDERVARAIYDSDIPVISAVGHEPDVTISDFVADLRAATPSNAAELAVPNAEDIRETLRGYDIRMVQAMRKQMAQRRSALDNLAGRRVLQSPAAYFDLRRVELDYTRSRLTAAGERWLAARRHGFAQYAAALDAMSPLKVLARGYAVATDADGTVLRSAAKVQPGDPVRVQLQDGALHCTVNNREDAHGKTETDL